jgi:hypothetical protein
MCRCTRKFAGCRGRNIWRQGQMPSSANTATLALRLPEHAMKLPTFLILDFSFADNTEASMLPMPLSCRQRPLGDGQECKATSRETSKTIMTSSACLAFVEFSSIGIVELPLWICGLVQGVHRSCFRNHAVPISTTVANSSFFLTAPLINSCATDFLFLVKGPRYRPCRQVLRVR